MESTYYYCTYPARLGPRGILQLCYCSLVVGWLHKAFLVARLCSAKAERPDNNDGSRGYKDGSCYFVIIFKE